MAGVLDGVRVLDFGRYIAGPFCGMLLGDMGAEVISCLLYTSDAADE